MGEKYRYADGLTGALLPIIKRSERAVLLRRKNQTFYRKQRPQYQARPLHPCEAPFHAASCNRIGSTKDHFTPKSILKELKKKYPDKKFSTSIQRLSPACHHMKDESTEHRLWQVRTQLLGASIQFGEHLTEIPHLPHFDLPDLTPEKIKQRNLTGKAIHTYGYAKFQGWSYLTSKGRVFAEYVYALTSSEGTFSMPLIQHVPFAVAKKNPPSTDGVHLFMTNATIDPYGDGYALFAHTISTKKSEQTYPKIVHVGAPSGEQMIFSAQKAA